MGNIRLRAEGRGASACAEQSGFLTKILRSRTGNILPMVAAGLIPMLGMIGGAVDMSRAYMVQSRLQQACDAGVLAGRRAMSTGTYNDSSRAAATQMFNVNYPDGYMSTEDRQFLSNSVGTGTQVAGTATVNVPTVIMGIFGKAEIPVEVECQAELNVSNSDITFVLDTTGSMSGSISGVTRIQGLRNAVMSFYDALAGASQGSNTRVRYGFVPYAVGVNVGELIYDTNPTYLVGGTTGDSWSYQSRRPIWRIETQNTTTVNTGPTVTNQTYSSNISRSRCENYGDNVSFSGFSPNPSGSPTVQTTTSGNTTTTTTTTYSPWTWGGASPTWSGSGNKTCVRRRSISTSAVTTTTTVTYSPNYQAGATFDHYEYLQRSYTVDGFVRSIKSANPAVLLPSEQSATYDRWNGCIEERDTTASGSFSYAIGSGITASNGGTAHDLNIDLIPSSTATKWRPYWDAVYWLRNGTKYTNCPAKSKLLSTMTRTAVQNYVNALTTGGNTYHDIGMVWGGRISSPDGIFRANVVEVPSNQGVVNRHLIYMTDGELQPYSDYAAAWGIESIDRKVTGGSSSPSLYDRHRSRFLALCQAVKGKGIRVWVVAFGTGLTDDLRTCASQGSAFAAANSSQLQQQFVNIARQISELRLTQ